MLPLRSKQSALSYSLARGAPLHAIFSSFSVRTTKPAPLDFVCLLLNCYFLLKEQTIIVREADLSENFVHRFPSVKCVLLFTSNKNCQFSLENGDTPKRCLLLLYVFLWKSHISDIIESSVTENYGNRSCVRRFFYNNNKTLEIFMNVASVAESHRNLQKVRTDTVVREVIFSCVLYLFFHFSFFL